MIYPCSLFRFSLSLRTESPKLEMYRQVAKDRGVDALKGTVGIFSGTYLCEGGGWLAVSVPHSGAPLSVGNLPTGQSEQISGAADCTVNTVQTNTWPGWGCK